MFNSKHKHEWETVPCIVTTVNEIDGQKISRIVEHCKDCGAYQSVEIPTDKMRKRFERDEQK